ncbi:MAG: hypothetical protein JWP01_691 [Myxococcales bacterium]|nr:hypothetical protein [Myxococcales bacterium]
MAPRTPGSHERRTESAGGEAVLLRFWRPGRLGGSLDPGRSPK